MSYYLKLGLVLLIITAIASGILAFVNAQTADKIMANKVLAEEEARRQVLPQASRFQQQSVTLPADEQEANPLKKQADTGPRQFLYYSGYNDSDELVGYTFVASKYGYSSEIKTMVGVDLEFEVASIKVIEQAETPGLGANAATEVFQSRFAGLAHRQLKVSRDGGAIESLTGATITSRAITNSIADGLQILTEAAGREAE
jgi:electron transport complex protein RnfG